MTTTTETFTAIICAECGVGTYAYNPMTGEFDCTECEHSVVTGDVDLEAGESIAVCAGVLGYVTTD